VRSLGERLATPNSDGDADAQKIALGPAPPLSKREPQFVTRYNCNGIAIEAFKRSLVRVQAGRIDADRCRGVAVWAG